MPQSGQMEKRDLNTKENYNEIWSLKIQEKYDCQQTFKKFMLKSVQNLKLPIPVSASISYSQETETFIQ